MSPYRLPEPPSPTDRVITLNTALHPRDSLHGVALLMVAAPYTWFVLNGSVEWLAEAPSPWRLTLCLAAALVFPLGILRAFHRGTLLIGARSLRQAGFFRQRSVRWADVTGVEHGTQGGPLGGAPLTHVRTTEGTLTIPLLGVVDPQGALDWALAAAVEGRTHEIAERVEREGQPPRGYGRYWPAVLVILLVVGIGEARWYRNARRRVMDVMLDAPRALPSAERAEAYARLRDDPSLPDSVRCRAATDYQFTLAEAGDVAGAHAACLDAMRQGCASSPLVACAAFATPVAE